MNTNFRWRDSIHGWLVETTIEELLFYVAFTLFSVAEVLQTTAFTELYPALNAFCKGMLILTATMLAFRLLLLREDGWQWIVSFVGFAIVAVIFLFKSFDTVFWLFLFVFAGKNADLRKLAKITLVVVTTITVVSILACYAGLVPNFMLQETADRAARSAMGFKHPNRLAERIAEICIAYWYLNSAEHRWRVVVLNSLVFLFVGFVADSRGSCVVFIALILVTLIYPHLTRYPRFSTVASFILIIGIVMFSFYCMVAYSPDNAIMAELNNMLSGRLSLMHQSYEYAGLTLFGADFTYAPVVGTHYLYGTEVRFSVDNSYGRILLNNGIATTALLFILITAVFLRFIKERRFTLALLGLTVILAFGFVENFMLDIQYNYFMFLAADVLFTRSIESSKSCEIV